MIKKTKSLLVVDDDPDILQIIDLVFDSSEFRVLQARNGDEVLKQIDAFRAPIDVLLIDVVMPGLNGIGLARVILYYYPTIKIIFMSGYPDEVLDRHGIPASKIRLIKKPFAPDILIQTVREELKR
jgi:DNA-binding response OmpR family regulator